MTTQFLVSVSDWIDPPSRLMSKPELRVLLTDLLGYSAIIQASVDIMADDQIDLGDGRFVVWRKCPID